ncbi:putative mediator of RNA polymerase II transcription subunit 26 isoform X2 [Culex quinquefasciatus]|uniref:putative mediator of RNA polymerase II transcription subunit 26 isoform X2 n=1 Tax=Culex quinquefasciatus TaxID=7176 RepID=UPI0018E3D18D|nr:putative mediator of RNA polymerase II transcription subunit 26 isoform X2 [Culex quinquefasciatus]
MFTVLGTLMILQASAASEKKPEKRPTKKASSAKPTKTRKSVVEEFTGLPPEDIDFIKELDRQFNEHGSKIRIKVQRDNSSDTRSAKRNIDGELGYGHYSNQPEGGYHFSKQKYMLYPYAQHNVHLKGMHSTEETVTELEITPSHSYELKPIEEVYQVYPDGHYQHTTHGQQYYHQQQQQHHQQQVQQQEDTPTIVLKIPGPAKYAQHLQALLQQYLEVRAAQLYKELQEQEYQHQQHAIQQQQQQLIHQQQQQQHYHQQQAHHHHHHHQQPQHAHQPKYSQQDTYATQEVYVPMYKTHHNTFVPVQGHYYESPKSRPTQPAYRKPAPTHIAYHSSPAPEHQAYQYETYHPQQAVPQQQAQVQYQYVHQEAPTAQEEPQQEYVYQKPTVNFVTPTPEQDEHHYQQSPKYPNFAEYHAQHQSPHQQHEEYLPEPKLVENYPSDKHTRVIYKSQSPKAQLQEATQEQPTYAVHQPTAPEEQPEAQPHQQDEQQQYIYQAVYPSQMPYLEDKAYVEAVTPEAINDLHSHGSSPEPDVEPRYNTEPIVAITQKPKQQLYNYHAHSPRVNTGHRMHSTRSASGSSSSTSKRASSKRDAPYSEDQFKKVNKMVHRMRKKGQNTAAAAAAATTSTQSQSSPTKKSQ